MIHLLLLLPVIATQWITQENEDCPGCITYSEDANFSSVISFESKVLVGARNSIYEIDFASEVALSFIDKYESSNYETCTGSLGNLDKDCQNYYLVMIPLNDADLFICGSSAFNPTCGVRTVSDLSYSAHRIDASGICPANPHASTTFIKLSDSQFGFVGTEMVSSNDYRISMVNLKYDAYQVEASTKPHTFWLNNPQFVYSFEEGDYVYFILKETAVEISNVEQVYSRVVRICKNDHGGGGPFYRGTFMTFVKARIYCSYRRAGLSPYDFNEVGGAYFADGHLYVLFSGPSALIETGSVLCRYPMEEIERVFNGKAKYWDRGVFKEEAEPSPFTCQEGRSVIDASTHQLMSGVISSSELVFYSPLQMNQLVIQQVTTNDEASLVATAAAQTGKLIRIGFKEDLSTVRHRTLQLPKQGPVLKLLAPVADHLLVLSHDWISQIPLQVNCEQYSTCQTCQTGFPHCGWCSSSAKEHSCVPKAECPHSWRSPYSRCPALLTFKTHPQDQTAVLTEGRPVREIELECESWEGAAPQWRKERSQLPETAEILEKGRVLRLTVERYSDAGTYVCRFQGEAGNVEAAAEVTVLVSPSFTSLPPLNVSVYRGEDATMRCMGEGNPKPVVTWKLRNGNELPPSARADPNTGELKLIRAVPADGGRFYCELSNGVGRAKISHDVHLTITEFNLGPDSNATVDASEPMDYKRIAIIVGCVAGVLALVALVAHCVLKHRRTRRPKNDVVWPGGVDYQEHVFGDQTPSSLLSPQYLEEQMHFEWGPNMSPMGTYLVPRDDIREEPPPAYHAQIELHPQQPAYAEHLFRPVVPDESGYSPLRGCSPHQHAPSPGCGPQSGSPPDLGPTPPPRADRVQIRSSPNEQDCSPPPPPTSDPPHSGYERLEMHSDQDTLPT